MKSYHNNSTNIIYYNYFVISSNNSIVYANHKNVKYRHLAHVERMLNYNNPTDKDELPYGDVRSEI